MGLFLAVRWVHAFVITTLAMAAWELYRGNGVLVLAGLTVATLIFSLAYFITVERALMPGAVGPDGRGPGTAQRPVGERSPDLAAPRLIVAFALEATGRPAAGAGQGAVRSCWT